MKLAYHSLLRELLSTVIIEVQLVTTVPQWSSCQHNLSASVRQATKSQFLCFQNLGFESTR